MLRVMIVLVAFAAFNVLTLTTPDTLKQNLNAWAGVLGRR